MLSSVEIENFQSHKNTKVELSPGVNAFIGNSDCGKSAILRSMLWAITNSPSGDAYVSHWARNSSGKQKDTCSVTLTTTSGSQVERVRSSGFNGYKVNSETFEALRTDVPEQVFDALKIGEVNIQRQLDGPFLLSMSPGAVARYINTLVNLSAIDAYQSSINSKVRKLESSSSDMSEQIDSLKRSLLSFDWVDEAEALMSQLPDVDSVLSSIRGKVLDIESSMKQYSETCQAISGLTDVVDSASDLVDWLSEAKPKISSLLDASSMLESSIKEYEKVSSTVNILPDELDSLFPRLERTHRVLQNCSSTVSSMESQLEEFFRASSVIESTDAEIEVLEKQLSTMVCPLCGRPGCSC